MLLTLRELKGIKLEDLISKIMNRIGMKHLDYPAFRTLNRLGKFVVLIDGFDEMATYATLNEMRENFLELAWQMHQENDLKINYKRLRSDTKDKFYKRQQLEYRDLDAFYGEIRTCTFLTRDLLGDYSFAHKSFMEYFTARYLAPLLQTGQAPETVLNEEIRQFIYQTLDDKVKYRSDDFRFTGDLPKGLRRKAGDPFTFIHEKDGSEMVWILPGPFISGGEFSDNEKPIRIRRLEAGGFLDKFLVTNGQYARFLNETGRFEAQWIDLSGEYKNEKCRITRRNNEFTVDPDYARHPVNFVSVAGAEAYADWVGKKLPSEWLWEKAGRGIDGRTYPWGDDWDWEKCNSGEYWAKKDLK